MELLEREPFLHELDTALADTAADEGRIVLVSGEAGIGKTALVEQFTRQKRNVRILWGACDALFTPRPLGPLHDMAGQTKGELASLMKANTDRPSIFAACLKELQSQPAIVVFEDIHWADEATLDLLKYLGRRIQRTQALLIATYRDDELSPQHPLRLLLGDLVRSTATRRLTLMPLSVEAVRLLASEATVDVALLHRQTGGNPFFVTEVLAAEKEGVPPTVRDAVLARAARLSLSGRAALNAAAVIGARIEPWLLAEVTRAEAGAIDESLSLGILRPQGEMLVFRHELGRQTILDTIPPHQRVFLHQAVLDALKTWPATKNDATRLAHHAEAAGDREAILAYAPVAGREAAALGMRRTAAALFALAIHHADDLPLAQQIDLHEAYALSAQTEAGRRLTIAAYRRAAELAHEANLPLREGFNLVRYAGTLEMIGENAEVDQLLGKALTILEPLAPNRGLADAYRVQAQIFLKRGEPETAITFAEKGYQMALKMEQIQAILSASQFIGLCLLPIDHPKGCEHLEQCLTQALENKVYWIAGSVYPNLIMNYIDVFKLQRAEELLAAALPYVIEHDIDPTTHMLQAWQAMLRLYQGQWHESATAVETLLQHAGLELGSRNPALAAKGRLLARQGKAESAQKLLDEALEQTLHGGHRQRMGMYFCARAEAAWLAGDHDRVLQYSTDFYDMAVRNKQPGFAAELAYWRWRAGETVDTFDWMVRPFVLEIKGDWRGAAAAWEALGCPYEQARALAGGDTEAKITALAIFEQLGAQPMIERTRQKLRHAGVQTIPRGPRAATRENPFGLTNRQLEILTLLTENLTNAEIAARLHISPKTAGHHVSAVLAKLDVNAREEAAELARQHPDLNPLLPKVS